LGGTVQDAVSVTVVTPSVFLIIILVRVSVDTVLTVVGLGKTVIVCLAVADGLVIVVEAGNFDVMVVTDVFELSAGGSNSQSTQGDLRM
jgi:hypothetical protein